MQRNTLPKKIKTGIVVSDRPVKRKASSELFIDEVSLKKQRLWEETIYLLFFYEKLSLELWVDNIVPFCSRQWLGVSKQCHDEAISKLFQKRYVDRDLQRFLGVTVKHGHILAYKSLLAHYPQKWIVDLAICLAIEYRKEEIFQLSINHYYGNLPLEENQIRDLYHKRVDWDIEELLWIANHLSLSTKAKEIILHKIVPAGDNDDTTKELLRLLLCDSHVNPFKEGNEVLNAVLYCGLDEIALKLLDKSGTNTEDELLEKIMYNASKYCNLTVVTQLFQHFTCFTNTILMHGIIGAARGNKMDIFHYLLSNSQLSTENVQFLYLQVVFHCENMEVFKTLLKDKRLDRSANKGGALYYAIRANNIVAMHTILKDTNFDKKHQMQLARMAAAFERVRTLNWLLEFYSIDPSEDSQILKVITSNKNK